MSQARCFIAAVLAALCGACVAHPVGPARTFASYEGKAVTTAEGVLSAVETARLAARTADKDNAFGPYLSAVASEAEEAASGLEGTFDSIQPPDGRADDLRAELDQLIGDAVDHLASVRIALRRDQISSVAHVARPLTADAKKLSDFVEEHQR